jgi:hypothetical protein
MERGVFVVMENKIILATYGCKELFYFPWMPKLWKNNYTVSKKNLPM